MSEERKNYKIQAMVSTSDYRGDHSADVLVAVEVEPWETVGQLVMKTIAATAKSQERAFVKGDHIQLRIHEDTSR